MTQTEAEKLATDKANCAACMLAEAMKDCQICQFYNGLVQLVNDDINVIQEWLAGATPQCQCTDGTVYKWRTYPATREDPSETVGRVRCDECGEEYELGYEPENMNLRWIEE